jgi:hypothetical protein
MASVEPIGTYSAIIDYPKIDGKGQKVAINVEPILFVAQFCALLLKSLRLKMASPKFKTGQCQFMPFTNKAKT